MASLQGSREMAETSASNMLPTLLPSPLLQESSDPLEHSTPSGHDNPQHAPDEAEEEEIQPPPDLRPFYTLIKDTSTLQTHHNERLRHPHVHYLFRDDDPVLLTHALLYYLDGGTTPASPSDDRRSSTRSLSRARLGRETDDEDDRPQQMMPAIPSTERTLILDMDASGRKVVKAQSMTSTWQVRSAEIGPAPTFDGEDEGGLMMMIEGVENNFPAWTKFRGTEQEFGEVQEQAAQRMLDDAKSQTQGDGRSRTEDLLAAVDSLRARFDEGLAGLHGRTEE